MRAAPAGVLEWPEQPSGKQETGHRGEREAHEEQDAGRRIAAYRAKTPR